MSSDLSSDPTRDPTRELIRKLTKAMMAFILVVLLVLYVVFGRDDNLLGSKKAIPAGVRVEGEVETTLVGYIGRVWGGDNFEFGDTHKLHYCWLAGVDCPENGQPYYADAMSFLLDNYRHKTLEMEVAGYDEFKREYGQAFHTDEQGVRTDVGLQLIKHGMAWYDGSEFEGHQNYQKAQQQAQEAEIGLWSDPSPMPPWEFWERRQAALRAD